MNDVQQPSWHITDKGEVKKCGAKTNPCKYSKIPNRHFEDESLADIALIHQYKGEKAPRLMKIYRVGSLDVPEAHSLEDLNKDIEIMDRHVPEGRQGRGGALYTTPDLPSSSRWVLGNEYSRNSLDTSELVVDANKVYIYPVDAYERLSSILHTSADPEKIESAVKEYWELGMTLTEWQALNKAHPQEYGKWEILAPPTAVESSKPVTTHTVLKNSDPRYTDQLNRLLNGGSWRRPKKVIESVIEPIEDSTIRMDMEKLAILVNNMRATALRGTS